MIIFFFIVYWFFVGNMDDIVYKVFVGFFYWFVFYDDFGIEVNLFWFVFSQSGVGGNFYGRNKCIEWSIVVGSEEYYVIVVGGEGGGSY